MPRTKAHSMERRSLKAAAKAARIIRQKQWRPKHNYNADEDEPTFLPPPRLDFIVKREEFIISKPKHPNVTPLVEERHTYKSGKVTSRLFYSMRHSGKRLKEKEEEQKNKKKGGKRTLKKRG